MFPYNAYNYGTESTRKLSLIASGTDDATINISSAITEWSTTAELTAGGHIEVEVPQYFTCIPTNIVEGHGIRVTSTADISLYASNYIHQSYDITTVLPTSALRGHYIVQDYPGSSMESESENDAAGSELGIVATEDGTEVQITLTASDRYHRAGETFTITLNAGYDFQLLSNPGNTFSGTEIISTNGKPIAVFQGTRITRIPDSSVCCGDCLYEQAVPVDYWGKDYILVPEQREVTNQVRVTASENDCQLSLDGTLLTSLSAKQTFQLALPPGGAKRLTSTKPVTVCLYLSGTNGGRGDPASVIIPPVEQGVCSTTLYAHNTLSTDQHYTNIVTTTASVPGITLDGNGISSYFTPLQGTPYSYATVPISSGTHTLANSIGTFSAFFYGTGTMESFAYTAGMSLKQLHNEWTVNNMARNRNGDTLTVCHDDTMTFTIKAMESGGGVRWYIDDILQSESTMTLRHKFPSVTDTHTVAAVLNSGCTTGWCDTLSISIITQLSQSDTFAVACNIFTWYDSTYTASSTSSTHNLTTDAGCDSIVTLLLTIRHASTNTIHDTIVENQLPYTYLGATFTSSIDGTTFTIPNAAGCDSVITYSLFVHRNVSTTIYDTLCNNALPYHWNGVTFDAAAVSQSSVLMSSSILQANTGADSVVHMHLTVHPNYDHHTHADICDNQQYTFGDSTFLGSAGSTTHLDSLLTQYGCDSLSSLHLSVHPTFDHHSWDTICDRKWNLRIRNWQDRNYTFGDSTYNATGVYTHHLLSRFQCDSLSTLHLQVWPSYDIPTYDSICDRSWRVRSRDWQNNTYSFLDSTYSSTGVYRHSYHSEHGCDSMQTLHLAVHIPYEQHLYDTIYEGDSYAFEGSMYQTTGEYPHVLQTIYGCDSLRMLHLQRNRRTYVDSTLCQNHLPLLWNTTTFSDQPHSGGMLTLRDSVHLIGLDGIDSLVVMTVHILDTSTSTDPQHGCDSLRWQDGNIYTASTHSPTLTLSNQAGCDSVVHLNLTIDLTHRYTDHVQTCDSLQWLNGQWYYSDTIGPMDTLRTTANCDSIVTLDLTMYYSTYQEAIDTFCHAQQYLWHGFIVGEEEPSVITNYYLSDSLLTTAGCDSVLAIHLTQMVRPQLTIEREVDCRMLQYQLTLTTDMPYNRWWAEPTDAIIDSIENTTYLIVTPESTTDYHVLVDYHQRPLCPLNGHITLQHIELPTAELKVNPQALTLQQLELEAYDISREYENRTWYINWQHQAEEERNLHYTADRTADSVTVSLSVYNGVCYDTTSLTIPILKTALYAPNIFTPEEDINNRFLIKHIGVLKAELFIYNREGLLVYHTTDLEQGWDGHDLNGNLCKQTSYVWKLIYRGVDLPSRDRMTTGTVLLLR